MLLQQILNGLVIGLVYALTAMGATLIYGILRILDIANAGAYVIGAYIGWFVFSTTGNIVVAFVVSMVATGLLGVVVHRVIYAPILAKPRLMPIIPLVAAVGLFTLTADGVRLVAGAGTKPYNLKFETDAKMGLAWRGTAEDAEIAQAMGVNTKSAMALSYIIGYGFAAAAGIMVGILYNSITPALGDVPSYKMLAIIVLGGLGNPVGTILAGILVGLAETLLSVYVDIGIPKDSIAFIALIIVLLVKPDGLISRKNKTS